MEVAIILPKYLWGAQKFLWTVNVLASALVVWRLYSIGLHRIYRWFFASMALAVLRSAALYSFSPRGGLYYLIWALTEPLIWLSYVAISVTLIYLERKLRQEMGIPPFQWVYLAFGAFIVACGFTHFMEIVVLWKPVYWLSGAVKVVTAAASVGTRRGKPRHDAAV